MQKMLNAQMDNRTQFGGVMLCNEPVALNVVTPGLVNNLNVLMQETITPTDYNKQDASGQNLNDSTLASYIYNYSITCWFFIENATNSVGTLFTLAGNPLVSYDSSTNAITLSFITNSTGEISSLVLDDIKAQKWNFLAINVQSGYADIFLNGKLVDSFQDMVPYFNNTEQSILVGSLNGVTGQICSYVYYPNVLSISNIEMLYTDFIQIYIIR
jgi:hypothetical protein